jgi:hypothetical protein
LIIQFSDLSVCIYPCAIVRLCWLHDVALIINVLLSNADGEVRLGWCWRSDWAGKRI